SGFASTVGTALGGLVHVVAGSLGISAIILASAELFAAVKFVGALYLVWLGIRTFRSAGRTLSLDNEPVGDKRAFRDGVLVEALNPKTAAFFLAFIPQFLEPAASSPTLQFILLVPQSRHYKSHGLRLHYADWGNEGAPAVILVHGGRDHCRSWDVIARSLQPHFHVLAPDLRGHGDSDWTKGGSYALTEYVYDLA